MWSHLHAKWNQWQEYYEGWTRGRTWVSLLWSAACTPCKVIKCCLKAGIRTQVFVLMSQARYKLGHLPQPLLGFELGSGLLSPTCHWICFIVTLLVALTLPSPSVYLQFSPWFWVNKFWICTVKTLNRIKYLLLSVVKYSLPSKDAVTMETHSVAASFLSLGFR